MTEEFNLGKNILRVTIAFIIVAGTLILAAGGWTGGMDGRSLRCTSAIPPR